MVGHFWHFGRQDFGVLSLYRQRAQQVEPLDRNVDQWFSQIMMYVIQPCIYFRAFALYPFTVMVGWLAPLDSWFSALAHGAAALAVLCFFCVAFLEFRKPRRSIPKLLYYLVMASHPLFLYAGTFENSSTLPFPLLWQVSYFVSHWLIAILLTHKVNSSHLTRSAGSRWKATFLHFFPLLGLVSATSILLYFYGNQSILSGLDYLGVRAVLHQIKPEATLIAGIFFGYSLAEQLVHYWCDRCLYRFQDEKTRARVAPLL